VNLSLNVIRSRKRQRLSEYLDRLELEIHSNRSRFEEDTRQEVAEAIAVLEPETAHMLLLRYVHGYTDAEIAAFLGLSRGSVAMRVFRARARLKRLPKRRRNFDSWSYSLKRFASRPANLSRRYLRCSFRGATLSASACESTCLSLRRHANSNNSDCGTPKSAWLLERWSRLTLTPSGPELSSLTRRSKRLKQT
jgi:hypothetical protein